MYLLLVLFFIIISAAIFVSIISITFIRNLIKLFALSKRGFTDCVGLYMPIHLFFTFVQIVFTNEIDTPKSIISCFDLHISSFVLSK